MSRNPPENGLSRWLAGLLLLALWLLPACAPGAKWEALMVEAEMALQDNDLNLADQRYRAALRVAEGLEAGDGRLDLTLDRLADLEIAVIHRLGPMAKPLEVAVAPAPAQLVIAPPRPPAAPGGGFTVHLASYRSLARAERGWRLLQEIFPRLLGDLEFATEAVDLGARGLFQRVLTGPFTERATAEALCDRLESRKQYCRVVKRAEG